MLILFPVPIGADDISVSLPPYNFELLCGCRTFIVEEIRTARRFLKHAGYPHDINDVIFHVLNEHTSEQEIVHYLDVAEMGENIGLLSEAGLPCIADPGALVTRLAQSKRIEVVPLVGPSSLMLALMASGLNGQHFEFHGYLPVDRSQRASAIRALESSALKTGKTQIFIEAPYRNNQMLQSLVETCHPNTMICVACDLTLPTQTIRTLSSAQWQRQREAMNLHKRNTVFLIGR
ncbi:MAG: SAM-dependent methyltransferase [Bacteroidales bacterium]|nr:SAM-dependent methyltransferase [Bacteroidales bacterium]